ncbi:MAG: phosphoglycerate dehydrogenase [Oscillospiraceae bacterium]|nr:phosphoglycerate dehydrogenase [Oscillospiraceae bacterium]
MEKILITPRSFAKTNDAPKKLLESAGYELVVNPYGTILSKEQMTENIADVAGIIVGVDPLDAEVLAAAKKLRAIAKYGVGTDNIDLDAAKQRGLPVSITRGANSNAVADYAFALIMACARRLTVVNDMCHAKNWKKIVVGDVYGKTVGILGLGAIGKGVAKRAQGFDMKVLAYDIYWDEAYAKANNIEKATPEEIYAQCDFISLHMPLTDETRNMVDAKAFASMKKGTVLVNTARGGLIDEAALIAALRDGTLAGAGIDAFNEEPPANDELYKLENLIMGSHCGASTTGASEAMSMMAAQNLIEDLKK